MEKHGRNKKGMAQLYNKRRSLVEKEFANELANDTIYVYLILSRCPQILATLKASRQ